MCRKLKADEIECRVGTCNEKGCSLLLYKTARTDRAILTEMYGDLWQNDYKSIDGKMYCGIAIYNKDLKEWIWRWDVGRESNTEAVKGESSDSFKRAGFRFGIGIELYTAPFIWCNVPTVKNANGKYQPVSKSFNLKEIGYAENGDINKLVITDDKDNIVYKTGQYIKPVNPDDKLIKELNSKKDLDSLKLYYLSNYEKAVDKKAFTEAKEKKKKELSNGK